MTITMNELNKLYAAKLLETGSHDKAMLHVWWVAYNTDRPEGWAKKQYQLTMDHWEAKYG
jgi:hypothetical protein